MTEAAAAPAAPGMGLRRVDLLVVGAQKCATTWLYHCLAEHPGVFMPPHKREVEYLGSPLYEGQGPDAYWRLFAGARPDQVAADASVDYMYDPAAPALLAAEAPHVRLVASLRHPVDRAVSGANWFVRRASIPALPIDDTIREVLARVGTATPEPGDRYAEILHRGMYAPQLRRMLQHFDADTLLVALYDDVAANAPAVLTDLYGFAGIDTAFQPPSLNTRPKLSSHTTLMRIERLFPPPTPQGRAPLYARAAFQLINRMTGLMHRLGWTARPELDPTLRQALLAAYRQDIEEVNDLLRPVRVATHRAAPDLARLWR